MNVKEYFKHSLNKRKIEAAALQRLNKYLFPYYLVFAEIFPSSEAMM
jgi:hypothetical protein